MKIVKTEKIGASQSIDFKPFRPSIVVPKIV
jgi:hypothetical protein